MLLVSPSSFRKRKEKKTKQEKTITPITTSSCHRRHRILRHLPCPPDRSGHRRPRRLRATSPHFQSLQNPPMLQQNTSKMYRRSVKKNKSTKWTMETKTSVNVRYIKELLSIQYPIFRTAYPIPPSWGSLEPIPGNSGNNVGANPSQAHTFTHPYTQYGQSGDSKQNTAHVFGPGE